MDWLKEWFEELLMYAAQNPWQFLYYVLLCLSPFFLASAVLSWKLAKSLEQAEKDKKKKAKREANMAKTRRTKVD